MELTLDDIRADMDVYSADGKKIGVAVGISREEDFVVEPGSGGATAVPEITRYLQVDATDLLEEIGADDFWIPEQAIRSITQERGIVVGCSAAECQERYRRKPRVI